MPKYQLLPFLVCFPINRSDAPTSPVLAINGAIRHDLYAKTTGVVMRERHWLKRHLFSLRCQLGIAGVALPLLAAASVHGTVSHGSGFNGSDEIILTNRLNYMVRCTVNWTVKDSSFPNKSAVQDIGEDAAVRTGVGGTLNRYTFSCDMHPEVLRRRQAQDRQARDRQRNQEAERRAEQQRQMQRQQDADRAAWQRQAEQNGSQQAALERARQKSISEADQQRTQQDLQFKRQQADLQSQGIVIAQQQAEAQRELNQRQAMQRAQKAAQREAAIAAVMSPLMQMAAEDDARRDVERQKAEAVKAQMDTWRQNQESEFRRNVAKDLASHESQRRRDSNDLWASSSSNTHCDEEISDLKGQKVLRAHQSGAVITWKSYNYVCRDSNWLLTKQPANQDRPIEGRLLKVLQ